MFAKQTLAPLIPEKYSTSKEQSQTVTWNHRPEIPKSAHVLICALIFYLFLGLAAYSTSFIPEIDTGK